MGPNLKNLIIHKMSVDAIPPGGGMAEGATFLSDPEAIVASAKSASEWAFAAIQSIRLAAEPNPLKGADDETIAAEILRLVEILKATKAKA